jgi:protein-tyrosine kinase
MESITRAIQRAKEAAPDAVVAERLVERFGIRGAAERAPASSPEPVPEAVVLDDRVLRRNRIVAFDADAPLSRHYDLLRNQVTQNVGKTSRLVIAVSGPTRNCGATVTATNLALSLARNRAQRVVLVDANDQNISVRRYLGLPGDDVLRQQAHLLSKELVTSVSVGGVPLRVLTYATPEHDGANALIGLARAMRDDEPTVVVIDLPPLLTSDVAMSYIAVSTATVVVMAVGETTHAEVESSRSLLNQRDRVQYVLNKTGRHGL